ncbi:hypothetical protein LTR70_005507 [Exophiala xenobiotica]|uniref:Uncharacterized protein n=1 Tax=Lithohypha guttulata TaxID=1690604 RepID=A0ABR0KE81_9EURO|nr:hypothetical protein LTR24_003874 [Lithohypha guttulata]KAK5318364.1 hypothetical protein LTR70_005507 [Exophiala xenobiotica]
MQDVIDNPIYQQLQSVILAKGTSATRESHCAICLIAFEDEDYLLMDETGDSASKLTTVPQLRP